jgi:hypothetical protein
MAECHVMKASLYFIIGLVFVVGCQDEKKFTPEYDVPSVFEPFVVSFIEEASLRGHTYEINNLIIRYDATLVPPVCGNCNQATVRNDVQKIISVNSRLTCWTNDQELEALIFHELGHCFLGRQHLTDTLPNGDPKSIMAPDNNFLYSPCEYVIDNSPCNKLFKRDYYVDELFDPATPVPDWALQ